MPAKRNRIEITSEEERVISSWKIMKKEIENI